jgi:hypothetical protein
VVIYNRLQATSNRQQEIYKIYIYQPGTKKKNTISTKDKSVKHRVIQFDLQGSRRNNVPTTPPNMPDNIIITPAPKRVTSYRTVNFRPMRVFVRPIGFDVLPIVPSDYADHGPIMSASSEPADVDNMSATSSTSS